jgi:multiple sugar transport system permease protein
MTTQAAKMPSLVDRPKLTRGRIVAWAVMILLIFITLFPFWWVVRTCARPFLPQIYF